VQWQPYFNCGRKWNFVPYFPHLSSNSPTIHLYSSKYQPPETSYVSHMLQSMDAVNETKIRHFKQNFKDWRWQCSIYFLSEARIWKLNFLGRCTLYTLVTSRRFRRSAVSSSPGSSPFRRMTLKVKVQQSFDTSVTVYQSTRRNTPEDWNIQPHGCENLKFLGILICQDRVQPVLYLGVMNDVLWNDARRRDQNYKCYGNVSGPGYRSWYSDSLRAGRSGGRILVGGEIFRTRPDRPWSLPSLLYNGYWVFPGVKSVGACRWPPTPSNGEVKERLELYLNSTSGPSWPFIAWTLPLAVYGNVIWGWIRDGQLGWENPR
jgi:hypothetical protein